MASSAVPGIFPYQIIDGKIYIDGVTVNPLDYKGAIDRCRETVTSDS
jgi:predicted acylesterase/phospholipase RssA